jgi:hypothetical protein
MKEKIFQKLKAGVLVNGKTDISDETLNAMVASIGGQITNEGAIDEAIKPYVAVLKSVQGNINAVAASAVKSVTEQKTAVEAAFEKWKKDNPVQTPPKDPDPKNGLTLDDVKKLLEETMKPYSEKLAASEVEKQKTARELVIAAKVKELGLTEAEMKCVSVPEDKDAGVYLTEYKQNLIDRGLKPLDDNSAATHVDAKDAAETANRWLKRLSVEKPGEN